LLPVWSQFIAAAAFDNRFDTMWDWRFEMKKLLLVLGVALLGGAMVVEEAEARRLGGGRSTGVQRNVTAPPAQTPAKPAQQQAAPAGQQQNAAPAAAGQSRWLPMLGGLALGGLLGYLFAGNGLLGILLLALLAAGAVLAVRALMRRRTEQAPMQLAGFGRDMTAAPPPAQQGAAPQRAAVPAGFDSAGFLRAAKLNFVRLQIANDSGRLDEIREFTTPELFDELRRDVAARSAAQHTDVAGLDAELLEVATQDGSHWASVRFFGTVRESPGEAAAGFEEVWNLVKPVDGSSGWLLAGIQQMH
jgi:predicted lipid-binding transport protein (Tim44 family)